MKDTIYLRCDRHKVIAMTKSLPDFRRGDIVVKLAVHVEDKAFQPPVLETAVTVVDWRDGVDLPLGDVELKQPFITEAEAQKIREGRLREMARVLGEHGYGVVPPEIDDGLPPDYDG